MRFVPSSCLRVGMILGDNLYSNYGDLMLTRGSVLTEDYVMSIRRLQYNGVYIDDDISKDIEIFNVINDKVRAQTIKCVKNAFLESVKTKKSDNGTMKAKKSFLDAKQQIETIVDEIINNNNAMVNIIDLKVFDDYTYYHCVNVAVLSIVLGVALGLEKEQLFQLGFSALLHDIGKVFINKDILNKNGALTDAEYLEIKKHSILGCNHIKKGYGVSNSSYMGILDHHEKYSGGGYPNNIKGNEISRFARIISVADVYDALTSDRPYRKALLPADAYEYIMASTVSLFDPTVVEVFVRKIAPYPIGTCVKLSNGLIGIVIENKENLCLRPKLRIFKNKDQDIEPYEIDLSTQEYLNLIVIEIV